MKINAEINGKTVAVEIDESELRRALEETKPEQWPREGETVWELYTGGTIQLTRFKTIYQLHNGRLDQGNLFRTKAEAERERDCRAAMHQIKEFIRENGMEYTPDWTDRDQLKWTYYYNWLLGQWGATYSATSQWFGQPCVKSSGDVQRIIDECSEHLEVLRGSAE